MFSFVALFSKIMCLAFKLYPVSCWMKVWLSCLIVLLVSILSWLVFFYDFTTSILIYSFHSLWLKGDSFKVTMFSLTVTGLKKLECFCLPFSFFIEKFFANVCFIMLEGMTTTTKMEHQPTPEICGENSSSSIGALQKPHDSVLVHLRLPPSPLWLSVMLWLTPLSRSGLLILKAIFIFDLGVNILVSLKEAPTS